MAMMMKTRRPVAAKFEEAPEPELPSAPPLPAANAAANGAAYVWAAEPPPEVGEAAQGPHTPTKLNCIPTH